MNELVSYAVAAALVAFIVFSVWKGTWYGTWCASGRKEGGRKFPGGPTHDIYVRR